jgi:dTDP-4-dehydrorhamnose 3,5-epimerase
VRCAVGIIYNVIIDLRPDSPTLKQHIAEILTEQNRKMLYIPEGFAHGFLVIEDNTEVFYPISEFYSPEHATGVRWNDPVFGIKWPFIPSIISKKDRSFSNFLQL